MDPASVVGLVASIVALIDATIEVVKYLNDVNDAPQEWTSFAQEASNLLSILTTLRYTVSGVAVDDPWFAGIRFLGKKDGPLDQFHESLAELTTRLKPHSNGIEFKRRLLWSFDKKYITEKFLQLERLKSLVNVALNRDQMQVSDACDLLKAIKDDVSSLSATASSSGNQVQELHDHLTAAQRREFLEWVSPLVYSSKQTDAFSRCQVGSYQWLLATSEFQNWMSNGDNILWGCGMPGAGKTTFTSFLVEQLSKSAATADIQILYVYFNYKEPGQTTRNIIGALVRQILEHRNLQSDPLLAKYNSLKNREAVTISDLRNSLYESLGHHSKRFVLFDALDEYDEGIGDRSVLMQDLYKLSKCPGTHVMVTSRWLASLQRDLSGSDCIEIRASDTDVEAYVRCQIQSSARLRGHLRQDESLEADIIKAVVASCQGMFLLAKLHMDSLSTKLNRKSIRTALSSLPRKLEETYLLVFERIESQNEDDANLAFQLLTWLTYSRRPLTVTELQHALAVNVEDESLDDDDLIDQDILLSVCAGIVVIEEQSQVIRLIHYTTEEYLHSIRQSHPMLTHGHVSTTKVCVSYLAFAGFQGELFPDKFPFYKYAANSWGEHARRGAEVQSQREILKLLLNDGRASAAALASKKGWDDARDQYGIHLAARQGLAITLSNLLAEGIDDLRYDNYGRIALHYACEAQHEQTVSVLLEHQCTEKRPPMTWLALHLAVGYGASQLVDIILNRYTEELVGQDPYPGKLLGCTVLHRAVSSCDTSISLLLSKWPPIADMSDNFGMTALHHASIRGNTTAAEALLLNGASPNMTDRYRGTPLLYAVQKDDRAMVELLIMHGAAERMPHSDSSLLAAAELGHTELLEVLLKHYPASINEPDATGWTALHFAISSRKIQNINYLLQQGAATNTRSHDGLTVEDVALISNARTSCMLECDNRTECEFMSGPDNTAMTNNQARVAGLEEKAIAVLEKLIPETENFVDWSTFPQILEMNDSDDEEDRFAHEVFTGYIRDSKRAILSLEEKLFLRSMWGVWSDQDNYKSQSIMLGFTRTHALWEQIHDMIEHICDGKRQFADATATEIYALAHKLSEAYLQEQELVHAVGKLPYLIGQHFDKLSHVTGVQVEPKPEPPTAESGSVKPSVSAVPKRRQSV